MGTEAEEVERSPRFGKLRYDRFDAPKPESPSHGPALRRLYALNRRGVLRYDALLYDSRPLRPVMGS